MSRKYSTHGFDLNGRRVVLTIELGTTYPTFDTVIDGKTVDRNRFVPAPWNAKVLEDWVREKYETKEIKDETIPLQEVA